MIKLSKKNGEMFEGTPFECARKLMHDALEWEIVMGGGVYRRWEAEDFCAIFGINTNDLR